LRGSSITKSAWKGGKQISISSKESLNESKRRFSRTSLSSPKLKTIIVEGLFYIINRGSSEVALCPQQLDLLLLEALQIQVH